MSATEITTDLFWDCECDKHYIRAKQVMDHCGHCGASAEEMPDSHRTEVESLDETLFADPESFVLAGGKIALG
jgi:hypothetical protein